MMGSNRKNPQSRATVFAHVVLAATVLVAAIVGTTGCKAYQFGAPTMHRFEIRSIHVPIFESESFRPYLGQRLTEAVVKELELNTPFIVTSANRADSILTGRIMQESKRPLSETINDDPRALQAAMNVEMTWTDRGGVPLMQRQTLRLTREVDFIPEAGQSLTTAQQELIDRIARQIVNQMEMPW